MKTVHYVQIDNTHYVREDDGLVICKMLSHPRQEQNAKDIAHALNQHDKLVGMLLTVWMSVDNGKYGAQCPGCGKCVSHDSECELTTLLKEDRRIKNAAKGKHTSDRLPEREA
ncbi:MAG: hypothetical protein GY832_11515 [Chloroflexi bacterium]|nr:hypothetical protein [Chloroflexota bacterium]